MGKEAGACPRCGSTNISSGPTQDDKDCVWCWTECSDCGFRFKDCYYSLLHELSPEQSDWLDFDEDY